MPIKIIEMMILYNKTMAILNKAIRTGTEGNNLNVNEDGVINIDLTKFKVILNTPQGKVEIKGDKPTFSEQPN